MSLKEYCKIENMVVSRTMQNQLDQIKSKQDLGNILGGFVSALPLVELFSGPASAGKRLKEISTYDWEEFGDAMMATHVVTRREINKIADEARLMARGQELKFWGCVYEATR
ncbi:hypothetical protein [uncultured Photobacterium sp.]|uniref:hypothetical protein n=1 Tax=uncultured Photobacterium sp. TaxID=173973 RepID=UPI002628F26E|nr:hypothetical protein [uncultured Photobacterium sp.]